MSDKQPVIKQAFNKWVERLGLSWWEITVRYYDDPQEIVVRFKSDDDKLVLARTYADWRYGTGTIDVNLPAWGELSDSEIERTVVHELIHILLNEIREGEMHHEERVVTSLTKAVFWVDQFARDA